jgi:hypothetical protein
MARLDQNRRTTTIERHDDSTDRNTRYVITTLAS